MTPVDGSRLVYQHLGYSEVQNLGDVLVGDEDVGRLDVAMDDAPLVRRLQAGGNLNRDVQPLRFESSGPPFAMSVAQRLPCQQLHHDEGLAFVFFDFVNRADMGVVQRRGGPRFAIEAL